MLSAATSARGRPYCATKMLVITASSVVGWLSKVNAVARAAPLVLPLRIWLQLVGTPVLQNGPTSLLSMPLAFKTVAHAVPVVRTWMVGLPRDAAGSSSVQNSPSGP